MCTSSRPPVCYVGYDLCITTVYSKRSAYCSSASSLSPVCRPVDHCRPLSTVVDCCRPLVDFLSTSIVDRCRLLSTVVNPSRCDALVDRCRPVDFCRPVDLCRLVSTCVDLSVRAGGSMPISKSSTCHCSCILPLQWCYRHSSL